MKVLHFFTFLVACCLRRAGVVTEMPPAPPPLDAWTVPAMPSGLAGVLIRDAVAAGALIRDAAHDPLLGGAPSAASEAAQPMSRTEGTTTVTLLQQAADKRGRVRTK